MTTTALYRNYRTKTVHTETCDELGGRAVLWMWAMGHTTAEIRAALVAQGGAECSSCQPLGAAS